MIRTWFRTDVLANGQQTGPRVAICPETRGQAEVEIEFDTSRSPDAEVGVLQCSRWPEHAGCAQACMCGIDAAWAATHGILVRSSLGPEPYWDEV